MAKDIVHQVPDIIKENALIGEDEYLNLFGPGGQLEGFSLSGISKNGENISSDQIQEIIMNLQQGNLELEGFSVE